MSTFDISSYESLISSGQPVQCIAIFSYNYNYLVSRELLNAPIGSLSGFNCVHQMNLALNYTKLEQERRKTVSKVKICDTFLERENKENLDAVKVDVRNTILCDFCVFNLNED